MQTVFVENRERKKDPASIVVSRAASLPVPESSVPRERERSLNCVFQLFSKYIKMFTYFYLPFCLELLTVPVVGNGYGSRVPVLGNGNSSYVFSLRIQESKRNERSRSQKRELNQRSHSQERERNQRFLTLERDQHSHTQERERS